MNTKKCTINSFLNDSRVKKRNAHDFVEGILLIIRGTLVYTAQFIISNFNATYKTGLYVGR